MQFDEFLSVIDLLKDTAKYSTRIAELQAREKAIVDATTQLGVVGDIAKAKQQAAKLKEQASSAVEAATVKAAEIVSEAQKAFDKRHAELKEREVLADQAVTNYNVIKAHQASREDVVRTKEKEVDALRTALQKQQEELAVKQVEVDERLAKLRQAMG
jgi:adenine-specific DNA methylase